MTRSHRAVVQGYLLAMFRLLKPTTAQHAAAGVRPAPPATADELVGLLRVARGGDEEAIRTLVAAVGPSVVSVARRVLGAGSPELEDVVQEALWGFLRGLDTFRGDCTVRHFACRVGVLTALKTRRKMRAADAKSGEDDVSAQPSLGRDPSQEAEAQARIRKLLELLDVLPKPQAEALALHCVAGFTIDEVAVAGGCGVETARSRLRLAKAALRARIESDPDVLELMWPL